VDGSEVGEVPHVVEFVGNDGVALGLHQVEAGLRLEVPRCQEVLQFLPDRLLGLDRFFNVVRVTELNCLRRLLYIF
jgi:hypothetical protein